MKSWRRVLKKILFNDFLLLYGSRPNCYNVKLLRNTKEFIIFLGTNGNIMIRSYATSCSVLHCVQSIHEIIFLYKLCIWLNFEHIHIYTQSLISQNENILVIHDEAGYNLLQKCVGANNVDLVRWILARHTAADVNRFPCSLPLHIACLKG